MKSVFSQLQLVKPKLLCFEKQQFERPAHVKKMMAYTDLFMTGCGATIA